MKNCGYFLFFLLLKLTITSPTGCSYESSFKFKLNQNDTSIASSKKSCIQDQSCCFIKVLYMEEVGGYHLSTCLPIDYDKNQSNYNNSDWREISKVFCNDFKLYLNKKNPINYVEDCQCGSVAETNHASKIFGSVLSVSAILYLISL